MKIYSIYGLTVASSFAFANRLAPGVGSPDVTFTCVTSAPLPGGWEQSEPVYATPPRVPSGDRDILLYHSGECWILSFRGASNFYIWTDRIVCHLLDQECRYLVEIQLLGMVLACWLELHGIPALHASAVSIDGRAVAFLSAAGGGKSSLAITLMLAGYPLLTDDILAVERTDSVYVGHPGYPQARMWPDQALRFVGRYKDLDLVHPAYSKRRVPIGENGLGTFCDTSQPLTRLYLPERRAPSARGKRVEINAVSRREGVMALLGQSFVATIVAALGLQSQRLGFFAQMVSEVPVRRVVYPDGYDQLSRVRRAILDDLMMPSEACSEQ